MYLRGPAPLQHTPPHPRMAPGEVAGMSIDDPTAHCIFSPPWHDCAVLGCLSASPSHWPCPDPNNAVSLSLPPVLCVVGLMANPRRLVPRARRASAAHGTYGWGARGAVGLARGPWLKQILHRPFCSLVMYVASRCLRTTSLPPASGLACGTCAAGEGKGGLEWGLTATAAGFFVSRTASRRDRPVAFPFSCLAWPCPTHARRHPLLPLPPLP